jgi:hypothetical protein
LIDGCGIRSGSGPILRLGELHPAGPAAKRCTLRQAVGSRSACACECGHTRQGLQEKAGFLAGSAQCSGHPYCKEVMLCNVLVALTVAVGATVALLLSPSDADLTRSADTDYMSIH